MTDTAIRVEGLAKRYSIGATEGAAYGTLRDALAGFVRAPLRALRSGGADNQRREIWALRDVTFDVERGEVLGIVGRNGAGKSTLLRVISRQTEPTSGRATLRGRLGSLLEVGTGFHPELSGRENAYLSGAILGMSRNEIARKLDQIVAFAEVEQFLDTPVKRYSSGMYMRLAFAVAAHLDPDILLVDEVLAVGDIAFREKCFAHMRALCRSGVTIVVVSHYIAQVAALTRRCLWLDGGRVREVGETNRVLAAYSNDLLGRSSDGASRGTRTTSGRIEFASVRTLDRSLRPRAEFSMGEDIVFEVGLRVREATRDLQLGISIYTSDGIKVLMENTRAQGFRIDELDRDCLLMLRLPRPPFLAGQYSVRLSLATLASNSADLADWEECASFAFLAPAEAPNATLVTYTDAVNGTGLFHWEGEWWVETRAEARV